MDEQIRKELFDRLATLLSRHRDGFELSTSEGKVALSTTKPIVVDGKEHQGYYFAGIRENKNIVGFYFMPIYTIHELRSDVPESLIKILKGNTCFNVKKLTPEIESGLEELIKLGIDAYRSKGWL